MGYSKRQFVEAALEEIGLAAHAFELQPDDLQSAVRRLDAMIAEWNAEGVRLYYPLNNSPENIDLDDATDVPDAATEAIITNLAIRLAPSRGKNVPNETRMIAKKAYGTLLVRNTKPPEMVMPETMPAGQGHKRWRDQDNPFLIEQDPGLPVGDDTYLDQYNA